MRTTFTGVGTALITPFTPAGAVDEAAVRRLARRQIELGTHFLVPCGTTGEVPTLSATERRRVVEIVVDEAGGTTPVLAGAGVAAGEGLCGGCATGGAAATGAWACEATPVKANATVKATADSERTTGAGESCIT